MNMACQCGCGPTATAEPETVGQATAESGCGCGDGSTISDRELKLERVVMELDKRLSRLEASH
jgi:hypothetical protein